MVMIFIGPSSYTNLKGICQPIGGGGRTKFVPIFRGGTS